MKTVYRTGFQVDPAKPGENVLTALAEASLRWVLDREGVELQHRDLWRKGASAIPETSLGGDYTVEARRVSAGEKDGWVLRFRHPHRDDGGTHDGIEWSTELGVLRKGNRQTFACALNVGRSDGAVAPVRFFPTRPNVMPGILESFKCGGAIRLLARPYGLQATGKDASLFRKLLESRQRLHPVVFVTPRTLSEQFVADCQQLADQLAGLAHVIEAGTPEATRLLGEWLPPQLNCFDGGVRIYWPGFTVSQSQYAHPLWTWWEVERLKQKHPWALSQTLLGRIAAVAVFSFGEDFLTWSALESLERTKAIEAAKAAGDTRKELELFVAENSCLEGKKRRLQGELEDQAQKLQIAQAKLAAYEAAFQRTKAGGETAAEVEPPVASVAEAVERAKIKFKDRLVFALNSKSDVDDNPFEDLEEVFEALAWLANTYFASKSGKEPGRPLKDDIREALSSWSYSGGQSDITITTFPEWYQCTCDGVKHSLGKR